MGREKLTVTKCGNKFSEGKINEAKKSADNTLISYSNVVVSYADLKNSILKFEYLRTLIAILPNCAYLKDVENDQYIYVNNSYNSVFHDENIAISDSLKEQIAMYEKQAIEDQHEIQNIKIAPLAEANGKLHELTLSFYPVSVGSKKSKYVLVHGSLTTENISSSSLHSLYKSYYTDEKMGLTKFIEAIGLSDYLEGKTLTPREFECLLILSKGLSAKEMARVLNLSSRTVENHIMNIKEKFEVSSNIELLSIFLSCYRLEG